MNRTIDYKIGKEADGLRVEQFLKRKGYSRQNLSVIKRMPKSILVNGVHYYMRQQLKEGDLLPCTYAKRNPRKRSLPSICRWISYTKTRISLSSISLLECPSTVHEQLYQFHGKCTGLVLSGTGETFHFPLLQSSG